MKRLMPLIVVLVAVETAIILFVLLAKPSPHHSSESSKIRVAVSVSPQSYFVGKIGGPYVDVVVMIPAGASPETYEPTPAQLTALDKVQVYFIVGHKLFPFEKTWMNQFLKAHSQIRIVDTSSGIPLIASDAHVWVSPEAVLMQAKIIYQTLTELDPPHASVYKENYETFVLEIRGLQEEIKKNLTGIIHREFLVFHPAWGYFAREFGLKQIAIEHEHKEPGPDHLQEVIELALEKNIHVIFIQPQFDKRHAEMIAKAIDGNVITVDPLAYDWLENMRTVAKIFARTLK